MKKLISLVLALAMIMMVGAAFADEPASSITGSITVTGLEAGDTVKYYKVIEWNSTKGWQFTEQFNSLSAADLNTILGRTVDAQGKVTAVGNGAISQEMAAKIAAKATTPIGAADTLTGTTWTKASQAPGLYMVQAASTGDTIYNPVFVAVQADGANGELALPANYDGNGQAKKTGTSIDKKAKSQGASDWDEWTTEDVGDIIDFKIETLVPVYNATYTNPIFKVSDTMTSGLTRAIGESGALGGITVKVGDTALTEGAENDYTIDSNTATGFVISFTKKYLTGITTNQTVVITYQAKITAEAKTVNPEENTAKIEYSRNPSDENDHGTKEDKTTHYTFDIDGGVTGNENYTSSEIIKVAVDEAGNPILEEKTYSNTTKHHPLAGAEFKLYTNEACTTPYTNSTITAETVFTSSDMGLLNIKGLDEGTYWLKETKAVDGYMLITTPVKFEIDAEYETVQATATCNAYKVLKSYTVKVNNTTTSTYTWDNGTKAVALSGGVAGDNSTEVENPKGVSLPSTGGIGTTIFYILGGLLVVGAAVILVARRKAQD